MPSNRTFEVLRREFRLIEICKKPREKEREPKKARDADWRCSHDEKRPALPTRGRWSTIEAKNYARSPLTRAILSRRRRLYWYIASVSGRQFCSACVVVLRYQNSAGRYAWKITTDGRGCAAWVGPSPPPITPNLSPCRPPNKSRHVM